MADSLIQTATASIGQVLERLSSIQGDITEARALINLMGWELPPGVEEIGLASLDLQTFLNKLEAVIGAADEEWQNELVMLDRIAELAAAVGTVAQQVRTLSNDLPVKLASFGDYVDQTNIHKELPKRLFDFLLANYIARKSPLGFAILHLINVIDYPHYDADPSRFQVEHVRATMNWHLLKTFVSDPGRLAREAYGWGTPQFLAMTFLQRVSLLFQMLGLRSRIQPLSRQAEEAWLQRTVTDPTPMPQLNTFLYEERGAIGGFRLGLSIFGARASSEGSSDGGLGVVPILHGQAQTSVPFFRFADTFIDILAEGDVLKRTGMILRPGRDVNVLTGQRLAEVVTGRLALGLRRGSMSSQPFILSFPGGTQFRLQQFSVTGGVEHQPTSPSTSFLELALLGCHFDCSLKEADGFLQGSLSQNSFSAPFDLRIAWNSDKGIHIQGGGGLSVTLPLHFSVGPFTLESFHLALDMKDEGLDVEASTTGSLRLGPVKAVVDRLGLLVNVSFNDGNLGLCGLSPRFKPPTGVGITVESSLVTGGGFLFFDPAKAEYGGILQLEVAERIAVKAIGLLTTRLPGGAKGYSLLILISAEGFAPIQLGLGFTLNGIGGLLGVNRTVMVDVLRGGIKQGTLGSVLFPQDPIRNAPQIVSDLRAIFPPAHDRFLFGPMAIIGWGTPTILSLELALILELPEPVRLIILGRLQALLPDEAHAVVRVRMDAIGVIDFNTGEVALDAVLYDSRILTFALTGEMALRASWGRQPRFVLAIGGFHPRFAAPAGFPQLNRLALSISDSDTLRLRCDAYLALTSNTVQFGARVELHAAGGGFSFDGYLGFDALFQLSPFAFVVDLAAGVALRYHGHLLMGIFFEGQLSGPTPWFIQGKATIKIWFVKVTVDFKRQFGPDVPPPLPEPINVQALVLAAVQDARNWSGALPQGAHPLVSFRDRGGSGPTLFVHPLAELTVRQRVVPLNRVIDKVGSAPVQGARQVTLQAVRADQGTGALPLATLPVQEAFALAQFEEMSDEAKLARPSFEQQDAGLQLGTEAVAYAYDPVVDSAIAYETEVVVPGQGPAPEAPAPSPYPMPGVVLEAVVGTGAAGQAAIRRRSRARLPLGTLAA